MIALLLACGGDSGGKAPASPTVETGSAPEGPGLELAPGRVVPSPAAPAVPWVQFEAPEEGRALVLHGPGLSRVAEGDPARGIPLLGLVPGADWPLQVVLEGPSGRWEGPVQAWPVPLPPERVARLKVELLVPEESALGGQWLLASTTNFLSVENDPLAAVAVWDASTGDPVWWDVLPEGEVSVSPVKGEGWLGWDSYRLGEDGRVAAAFRQTALDGASSEQWGLEAGHHAARRGQDGRLTWLASQVEPGQGGSWVHTDRVLRQDDAGGATQLISLYDQVFRGALLPTCAHQTTPSVFDGRSPVYQWTHSNSLEQLPSGDWLVMSRWIDTLWAIGPEGELRWRLGGPESDFTWTDGRPLWSSAADSGPFSHPHFSEVWEGGALIFDNGDHRSPPVSRVVELKWDLATWTVEETWSYPHPEGRALLVLGDARRVGDNVLIAWTGEGVLEEVSRDGRVLWRGTVEPVAQVSRVVPFPAP